MAATICPSITATNQDEYREQIERIALFATRIHIDVADGSLTPNELTPVDQVWWPGGVRADIHVMDKQPLEHLPALIALGPQLIILHAEAEGDFVSFAEILHRHGVEAGIALLPETPVDAIAPGLEFIDHVLVFSGTLGSFGGTVDLALLEKVRRLKKLKPQLEIGWDGGVNAENAMLLATGGVEVLNVGGYIQKTGSPNAAKEAYATLDDAINPGREQTTQHGRVMTRLERPHAKNIHTRRTRA
jgi:ribulose-phosphate 3-epimerase